MGWGQERGGWSKMTSAHYIYFLICLWIIKLQSPPLSKVLFKFSQNKCRIKLNNKVGWGQEVMKKRSLKPQPVVLHKISRVKRKKPVNSPSWTGELPKKYSNGKVADCNKKIDAEHAFFGFEKLRNRRTRHNQAKILCANIADIAFASMAMSLQYLLFLRILF